MEPKHVVIMNTEIFTPEEAKHHHHFGELANVMKELVRPYQVAYDFGCGDGYYVKEIETCTTVSKVYGIEGSRIYNTLIGTESPMIEFIQWDLRSPLYIPDVRGFVSCIEVMEHIHAEYHDTVMDTLSRHCGGTLLLTWAIRGQTGTRHVAERDENEVVPYVAQWGFKLNREKTDEYRARVGSYMSKSIYLFER